MSDDLGDEVRRTADALVEMFRDAADMRFDYSEESLNLVEYLLNELAPIDDAHELKVAAEQFGCYILEIARRRWGGRYRWYEERDAPVLVVGEPRSRVALLTWDKIRGRLSGDVADNIPFFYQGFARRVHTAADGVDALHV